MGIRSLVYTNIITLIIMNLGNACNYAFQILAGRYLSPGDFGLFNALSSLAVIGSMPVLALPMVFSRNTVELGLKGKEYVARLLWRSMYILTLVATALVCVGVFFVPWIQSFLKTDASFSIFLMFILVAINLVRPVPWGVLQGLERFTQFAIVGGGSSLVRLLAGLFTLVIFSYGVNGALWAGVIGNLFGWAIAVWFLRDVVGGKSVSLPEGTARNVFSFSIPVSAANALLLMFGNLDMILAKHFCEANVVGLYASASVFGKIAFYLANVMGNVLFPKAAKGDESSLLVCLGLTGLLSGGAALLSFVAGDMLASLLFGEAYSEAGPLFKAVTFGMSLLAMVNVLIVYGLARQKYRFLWIQAVGVVVLATSIYLKHDSAMDIAIALVGSCALMLLGMIVWFFRLKEEHAV